VTLTEAAAKSQQRNLNKEYGITPPYFQGARWDIMGRVIPEQRGELSKKQQRRIRKKKKHYRV